MALKQALSLYDNIKDLPYYFVDKLIMLHIAFSYQSWQTLRDMVINLSHCYTNIGSKYTEALSYGTGSLKTLSL